MSEAEVGSRTDSRIRQAGTGSRSDREDDTAYLAALAGQGGGGAYGLSGLGTLPSWTPPYALGGDVQAGRDYPFAVAVSPSATNLPRALSRGAGGEGEDAELAVGRKEIYIPEPAVTFNGEPVSVGGNFPGTLSAGGWSTLDAEAEALYVKIRIDASGEETKCTAEWATEPSQGGGEPAARNTVEFSVPIAVGIPNGSWGRPRQVTAGAIHLVDPFLAREDSGSGGEGESGGCTVDGKSVNRTGEDSDGDLQVYGWASQDDENTSVVADMTGSGDGAGSVVVRSDKDGELKYVPIGKMSAANGSGLALNPANNGSVELDLDGRDGDAFQIVDVTRGNGNVVAKVFGTEGFDLGTGQGGTYSGDGVSVDESDSEFSIHGWGSQASEGSTLATSVFRDGNGSPIASGTAVTGAAVIRPRAGAAAQYLNLGTVGAAADSGLEFKAGGPGGAAVELDIAGRGENEEFSIHTLTTKGGTVRFLATDDASAGDASAGSCSCSADGNSIEESSGGTFSIYGWDSTEPGGACTAESTFASVLFDVSEHEDGGGDVVTRRENAVEYEQMGKVVAAEGSGLKFKLEDGEVVVGIEDSQGNELGVHELRVPGSATPFKVISDDDISVGDASITLAGTDGNGESGGSFTFADGNGNVSVDVSVAGGTVTVTANYEDSDDGFSPDNKSLEESAGGTAMVKGWPAAAAEAATLAGSMFGALPTGQSAVTGDVVMRPSDKGGVKYAATGTVGAAQGSGLKFKAGTGNTGVELDIDGRSNQTFKICSLKVKVGTGAAAEVAKFLGTADVTIEVPAAPSTKQVDVLTGVAIGPATMGGEIGWIYRPFTKKITVLDAPDNATQGSDVGLGLKIGNVVIRSAYSEETHKFTNTTREGVLAFIDGHTSETPAEVFEATAHEDEMDG